MHIRLQSLLIAPGVVTAQSAIALIVAVQSVLVVGLAVPFSRLYNQNDRQRLFGHFETSPPRGYPACREGDPRTGGRRLRTTRPASR